MRIQSGEGKDAGIKWDMRPRIRLPVAFPFIHDGGNAR